MKNNLDIIVMEKKLVKKVLHTYKVTSKLLIKKIYQI